MLIVIHLKLQKKYGNFESFLNQVIRSVVTYLNKAFQ